MMFPLRAAAKSRTVAGILSVVAVAVACLGAVAPQAAAEGPPLRHVKYTVFTELPYRQAQIYYRDVEPPNFAEYSHNPYVFSPKAEADLGPNQMWTLDVMLANPDDWAMVTASSLDSPQQPNFHCVIAVDGVVVKTGEGPKGALCSIRNW